MSELVGNDQESTLFFSLLIFLMKEMMLCHGGASCLRNAEFFSCCETGLISKPHLLFGEVRSVTAALKVVEEVQDCKILKENEKKRKLDGMKNTKSKSGALTTCMDDVRHAHNLNHDVVCRS